MKIVFLGTPEIAKTCLVEILKSKHEVLAVITKPDKPVGRGNKIAENPVKTFAKENNLPVFQFTSLSNGGVETLKKLKPDALVLVAFGQILSDEVLKIALPLNLHGSLLPELRGPSPIQTAILNGETESGLTVMKMASEVDSGDILLQEKVKIELTDTSKTLFEKMGEVGGKLLVKSLDLIQSGKAKFEKQDHKKATFTHILTKENASLDFNETAENVVNKIRAFNPDPVAFFMLDEKKYKVYFAKKVELCEELTNHKNGEIVYATSKQGLVIKAKNGYVEITQIQAPNGKVLSAKDFLNGAKIVAGSVVQ